jgi:hypothetical protein
MQYLLKDKDHLTTIIFRRVQFCREGADVKLEIPNKKIVIFMVVTVGMGSEPAWVRAEGPSAGFF